MRIPTIKVPEQWHANFTADDREAVVAIHAWLADPENIAAGWTQTQLGKRANVNLGTLNQVLQGKYTSPPTKHLKAVLEVIELQRLRQRDGVADTPYVETSVHRAIHAACKRARMYRNFAVVAAYVGTGKTRAVKRYAEEHSNVLLLEALPGLSAFVMLDTLVRMTSANVRKTSRASRGTRDEMFDAVIAAVRGTDSLLIVDEAETLTEQSLEYIRRLRDLAGIGVVLTGTERLFPLVRDPRGQFGQISSRVGFWPPVIASIREEDAEALARAALADDGVADDLTPEVLDAFWQVADGSARVLCEAIIPGVRDYGLRKGLPLSAELVFRVGTEVLGFRAKRRA
jgi:hypothetical protein